MLNVPRTCKAVGVPAVCFLAVQIKYVFDRSTHCFAYTCRRLIDLE